jgi:hypothetical protein
MDELAHQEASGVNTDPKPIANKDSEEDKACHNRDHHSQDLAPRVSDLQRTGNPVAPCSSGWFNTSGVPVIRDPTPTFKSLLVSSLSFLSDPVTVLCLVSQPL